MFRRFSTNFAVLSIFLDAALVAGALWVAVKVRVLFVDFPLVRAIGEPVSVPWLLYLAFPAAWIALLLLFSVYDGRRNLRAVNEFASLTLGSLLAGIAMAGVLYLSYREISRFLFLLFAALAYSLLLLWRVAYRLAYRSRMGGRMQVRRVLVLGAGKIGKRVRDQIVHHPYMGLEFTGFLDDDPLKQHDSEVLGTLESAREVVAEKQVDDVVIALPLSAHQRLTKAVSDIHDLPVRVWVIPDYFSMTLHRASFEELAGMPMLDLRAPALTEYQRMVKRAFDLTFSLLTMPLWLPLFGVIAVIIRLDSQGPIFYRAARVGEGGKPFGMYKFRSMVENADQMLHLVERRDEKGNLIYKTPGDPRVTRVGRILRRFSLDELPNIFNVIKGEMSLVGPRPEVPYLVEKYEPWQRKRFTVPQGMTGWWQINGRSDKPMHLHTEEDLYYVQHYSLWLDIQILLKTGWVTLRGKGAY
ncbi:MAG TPA: sugar transferase [Anaerolineaceae bacterium]